MARVLRYEMKLIFHRLPVFLLLIIGCLALLTTLSLIPFWGQQLPRPVLPEGMTPEQLQIQYGSMLQQLSEDDEERAVLVFFLATNTNQFDYIPLQEITCIHQGMENMAIAYSLSEGASFFSVLFGILAGMVLIAFPLSEKTLYVELSSNISRKDLFFGKCVAAIFSITLFHFAVFFISLLLSQASLGQLFLFLNGDECTSSSFVSILTMKTLGAFVGSLFFFFLTVLGSLVVPRPYVVPIFLLGMFVLCFLFSNVRPPEWGYYGMPSGASRYLLLAMPLSSVILGTNFGFLWESSAVLAIYALLGVLVAVISYRLFLRRDL